MYGILYEVHDSCSRFAGKCCKTPSALFSIDHIHQDDKGGKRPFYMYFLVSNNQFAFSEAGQRNYIISEIL